MRLSDSVKKMLKVLPVLAVLAATGIGLWIGNEIYPSSPALPAGTARFLALDQQYKQLPPGAAGTCASPLIYTSLPPKCKTADGTYTPLPGTSYLFVIPERK